jgi:A/G-specific adenine glycosylase
VAAVPLTARRAILAWYDARGRQLAFRASRDPWAILVSETMAQQTQVARADERWQRFMARFPTVAALAAASPADVLREWRGLGYNRRALNLWRAARLVVEEHDGRLPSDVAALQRLPGVGPYTARAVAAIAFGQPVGAVDTNVRRVLGRLGGATAADLQALADAVVPRARPADWTHALMDLGATVCRARAPRCDACPARAWCAWEGDPPAMPTRRIEPAFPSTQRWLRGRILDRLRDAGGSGWTNLRGPIGEHDAGAVAGAVAGLARDGLVERDPRDAWRCRLPLA